MATASARTESSRAYARIPIVPVAGRQSGNRAVGHNPAVGEYPALTFRIGYQSKMPSPTLVLITGLPGVGKSTFADRVAVDLGAAVVSHDVVMAGLRGSRPCGTPWGSWITMNSEPWVGP